MKNCTFEHLNFTR